jgi:2-polyprenyl-3-methyl-5-hydroxy-6-metoxy-1,4-benzoquinol methylase
MPGRLQEIYGKDYFFSGNSWGDGYEDYDRYSAREKHPWGFMVDRILQEKQRGKLLDCALGHFLSFFPETFEKYGADISEFAVKQVQRRFPGVNVAHCDISAEVPFSEKFDVITAFDVLEHALNLRGAMRNIHSMLKENGTLVVAVPVASRVHHLLAFFGRSFLTTMDSHLTLTTAKAWRKIIFPEFFDVVNDFPVTWKGKHIPKVDLFQVFFLEKK